MKKITGLLLTMLLICTMMSVAAVPASAEELFGDWSDIKNAITNGGDTVNIVLKKDVTVTETITIDRPCTVIFKCRNTISPYEIGYALLQAFVIKADNVTLQFDENITITNCKPGVDKGGAIYVSGRNCTIQGGVFKECKAKYGGAIYLDGCDCTITGSRFHYCEAGEDGGAIYVNDDAVIDGCDFLDNVAGDCGGSIFDNNGPGEVVIKNCTFEGGSCGDDGIWVDCYGDAIIQNCTPGNNDYYNDPEEYDESFTGSVLSEGNLWIIIVVAVVAVGGVVALIIVKKKKKPALTDGTEKEDKTE